MKLLIIEDSERLRKSLNEGLRRRGFAIDLVGDGKSGLQFACAGDYDAIVLDLMLPEMDGLTVLQKLRETGKKTNVLILSAKDQVTDRIRGLELGADDYLIKPFSFDELLARLKALVRRNYNERNPVIKLGSIQLNTALHQATFEETEIPLTPNEMTLLECLAMNRGRVMSPQSLLDHLYDSDTAVTRNAIEAHISALRKKLRQVGESSVIKTRRGFGYYVETA